MKNNIANSTDAKVSRRKNGRELRSFCLALVHIVAMTFASFVHAEIPEPDNVLYGTIVIGSQPVTASRTNVVVEARRTLVGPAIASYRMGSNNRIGNFYSLDLKLESITPLIDSDSSQSGENVYIVVKEGASIVDQTTYQFGERGKIQRFDFGLPVDTNGLPDEWEIALFGSAGQNPDIDHDLDGMTTRDEYIAGTLANDLNDVFEMTISQAGSQVEISFLARKAEGVGYVGMTRKYSLETKSTLDSSEWLPLPGFSGITGNNQIVILQQQATNAPALYRARVNLQSP